MADSVTDWMSAWANVVTAAAGVGVLATAVFTAIYAYGQIKEIRRQSRISARAATSQLYGLVSAAMQAVNDIFDRNPDWIEYFWYGKEAPALDSPFPEARRLRLRLDNMCEIFMDFLDGVVEQRKTSQPESMDWSTWLAYFRSIYANSPVLRAYIPANLDYYPDYVLQAIGFIIARDVDSGEIRERWDVHELDLKREETVALELFGDPLPAYVRRPKGYPWIRTWVIRRLADDADKEEGYRVQEGQEQLILAAVGGAGENLATVHLRSRGEVTAEGLGAARDWILDTLSDSERIRSVDFFEPNKNGRELITRYRPRHRAKLVEPTFLAPSTPRFEPPARP